MTVRRSVRRSVSARTRVERSSSAKEELSRMLVTAGQDRLVEEGGVRRCVLRDSDSRWWMQ